MTEWGESERIDDNMVKAEEKKIDGSVYYEVTCECAAREKVGNRIEEQCRLDQREAKYVNSSDRHHEIG